MADSTPTARLKDLGINANGVIRAITTIANEYAQEAKDARQSYQELLGKHRALQREHAVLRGAKSEQCLAIITDPYVMVLVDAHTHKFQKDLLALGAVGGPMTARLLRGAIQPHLNERCSYAEECRIIVRVYADLKSLSVEGCADSAGFAAAFSREDSFFDFVDVSDKDFVKSKIVGNVDTFEHSVRDIQCRHILLGASDDSKYMRSLEIHPRSYDKVWFIESRAADKGVSGVHLKHTTLAQIFCTMDENDVGALEALPILSERSFESQPCAEYQKGFCPRKNCERTYIDSPSPPVQVSALRSVGRLTDLPKSLIEGRLALNVADQRLDIFLAPISSAEWSRYKKYHEHGGTCRPFHLQGSCDNQHCKFSHAPNDESIRKCLANVAMREPCRKAGQCRTLDCFRGHVCQKVSCLNAGGRKESCRMPKSMHSIDCKPHKWVCPTEAKDQTLGSGSESSRIDSMESLLTTDSNGYMTVSSSYGTGSSIGEVRSDVVEPDTKVIYDLIDL